MTYAHGLTRYKKDRCRCQVCRAANKTWQQHQRRMVAYNRWEGHLDVTGTRRRIQALMRNGWSLAELSGRLGCSRQVLRKILHVSVRVTPGVAGKVRVLYDELWDHEPPGETKWLRRAATMACRYAREHGFVPPMAWDDDPGPHCIDDPAAVPAPLWDAEPVAPVQRTSGSPLVAAAIRQARERAELSQRALAEAAGVTESYIQLIEYGKRNPSVKTWQQLELTLGPLGIVREAPEPEAEANDAAA